MADEFKTPVNKFRTQIRSSASTATKRDSLAAELERDPQLSTAKRQQRTQILNSAFSHSSLERQLHAAQQAKMELESKLRESEVLVERLQRDRRLFADRETAEREEKERIQTEMDESKRASDAELRSLRTALTNIREDLQDSRDAHSALQRNTSQALSSHKSQIAALTTQQALLESELAQFKDLASRRAETIQQLQSDLDDVTTAHSQCSRRETDEGDMSIIRAELSKQATYTRSLESTNSRLTSELAILRDRHSSVEVLKEEKRTLERKLVLMEEMRSRVVRLEGELDAARKEREEWAAKSRTSESENLAKPSTTPISVTQTLSDLRLTHARLLEEHGATVATLRSSEARAADRQKEREALEADSQQLKDRLKIAEEKIRRRETRATLAEREVGFLQALVASYTAEEESIDPSIHIDEAKVARIEQLQTLLQEYKSAYEELQASMDEASEASVKAGGASFAQVTEELEAERKEKEALLEELSKASSANQVHLDKVEELEQTLFELQGEIAGGRHVPPNTRVLTLSDNPESQWFNLRQAALDRLKAENEALLNRLKDLEAAGAHAQVQSEAQSEGKLVPLESYSAIQLEKDDLVKALKQKETRLARLQSVFQSKSAEFREAIASILGVKLAFYPNGQVKVTSVYDLGVSFIFQPAAGGEEPGTKMQLAGSGEECPDEVIQNASYWLDKSIPCFMASITLECYDKHVSSGQVD